MEMPDLKVIDVHTQVFVENLLNRSVRLDILATDSTGRKINVEIQRSDKGAGRKRARYNSSMMDANLLKKGDDFNTLAETYVIFITENDVLKQGKPLYQIERCILGTGERFNDGSHILYVNGAYRDDTPIGKLMHDFSCTNPADMYYGLLADRVRFFKESKEGVAIMCKAMEDMRNQTLREGMKAVALRMLQAGKYALEEIADISGLPLDEVKQTKQHKQLYRRAGNLETDSRLFLSAQARGFCLYDTKIQLKQGIRHFRYADVLISPSAALCGRQRGVLHLSSEVGIHSA